MALPEQKNWREKLCYMKSQRKNLKKISRGKHIWS